MEIPKNVAIELLCKLIDELPQPPRHDVTFWACAAVGKSPEPTGLEPLPHRTLGQLQWDLTTDDLRKRLSYLVEDVGLFQQTVVNGVISFLETWYSDMADKASAEEALNNYIRMIEHLDSQLTLRVADRQMNSSDDELREFRAKVADDSTRCEERRQGHEETLNLLREKVFAVFTPEVWKLTRVQDFAD
jgi:hypothetical protein